MWRFLVGFQLSPVLTIPEYPKLGFKVEKLTPSLAIKFGTNLCDNLGNLRIKLNPL